MGYLEANRFGYAISGSHSSRTAEGDNSVLMNKVASELIQRVDQNEIKKTFAKMQALKYAPSFLKSGIKTDPKSLIETLATFKEYSMCNLAMEMFQVFSDGIHKSINLQNKKSGRFTAWMEKCQNEVQQAARGYGEHLVANDAWLRIQECENSEVKTILTEMLELYMIDAIRSNAGEYLKLGLLDQSGMVTLDKAFNARCASIGRNSVNLTDAFGFSDQMLATPCSMDWIDYNSVDNQGEVVDFMAKL